MIKLLMGIPNVCVFSAGSSSGYRVGDLRSLSKTMSADDIFLRRYSRILLLYRFNLDDLHAPKRTCISQYRPSAPSRRHRDVCLCVPRQILIAALSVRRSEHKHRLRARQSVTG